MLSNSKNEMQWGISNPPGCDCCKRVDLVGIPLYIDEESDDYPECQEMTPLHKALSYESAFRLSEYLKISEYITEYPIVEKTEKSVVFQQMAGIIPTLSDFEINVLSFWMLDMFIEGLWTAQKSEMNQDHQKATLEWIAYFFNYVKDHNPTRQEFFRHLKMALFLPDGLNDGEDASEGIDVVIAEFVERYKKETEESAEKMKSRIQNYEVWKLPRPPTFDDVSYKVTSSEESSANTFSSTVSLEDDSSVKSSSSILKIKKSKAISKKNLRDMEIILEILYRIFGTFWVFKEIQMTFGSMPSVEKVYLPFTLNIPKPIKKLEAAPAQSKTDKGSKKANLPHKSTEEIETERQLQRHDFILPLQASEETELYLKVLFGWSSNEQNVHKKGKDDKNKK